VGHNPDAFAEVRGADRLSRYAVPVRVIPERGQVTKNVFDGWTGISDDPILIIFDGNRVKEPWRVLHEHETGS
jgi:hypothetical protein